MDKIQWNWTTSNQNCTKLDKIELNLKKDPKNTKLDKIRPKQNCTTFDNIGKNEMNWTKSKQRQHFKKLDKIG